MCASQFYLSFGFYDDYQRSQVAFATYLYHNLKQLQSVLFYVKNHVYSGSENKCTTGLVLLQGYVPEQRCANPTQNVVFKTV